MRRNDLNARRVVTTRCAVASFSLALSSHFVETTTTTTTTTTTQPIVSLDAQDTVAQALSTLSKANILSAPLVVGQPPSLALEGRPPVGAVAAFVGAGSAVVVAFPSMVCRTLAPCRFSKFERQRVSIGRALGQASAVGFTHYLGSARG